MPRGAMALMSSCRRAEAAPNAQARRDIAPDPHNVYRRPLMRRCLPEARETMLTRLIDHFFAMRLMRRFVVKRRLCACAKSLCKIDPSRRRRCAQALRMLRRQKMRAAAGRMTARQRRAQQAETDGARIPRKQHPRSRYDGASVQCVCEADGARRVRLQTTRREDLISSRWSTDTEQLFVAFSIISKSHEPVRCVRSIDTILDPEHQQATAFRHPYRFCADIPHNRTRDRPPVYA